GRSYLGGALRSLYDPPGLRGGGVVGGSRPAGRSNPGAGEFAIARRDTPRFAMDSPLEGVGFEPSVPGEKPWVPSVKHFADSCRQAIRLSYSRTLRGCWVPRSRKREHGLAPLSRCGPSLILGVELLLDAFFCSPGLSARDQRVESGSLQRRVCDPSVPPGRDAHRARRVAAEREHSRAFQQADTSAARGTA